MQLRQIFSRSAVVIGIIAGLTSGAPAQQTAKVGVIIPLTGTFQSNGRQIDAAIKAFVQANGNTTNGKRIEIVVRDDASTADNALRLAQELVTKEKVAVLAGFGNTPTALAVASFSARAKIPQVVMVAATSSIMDRSPYMVRTAQTIPQIASIAAQYAVKSGIKSFVTVVSDYGPGVDAEEWFAKTVEKEGAKVTNKLRVPLANPDFAPFLQRAADEKPEGLFVFVPTGAGAAFMKQYVERGLDKSGIKVVAMSDVVDDDLLNNMGDVALGIVSVGPYSASHDSTVNKEFVAKFKAVNNGMRQNVVAVGAWDALTLIYKAIGSAKSSSGDDLLAAMKGQSWESPRGPITIDAQSRDIVQNIYVRRVERVNGELYNTEFQTFSNVRDPAR
jgi:branched-chain amino acid transport system substrate-binding protein